MQIRAIPGLERTSETFRRAGIAVARRVGMDPNHLFAIEKFESDFDPAKPNAAGSGAMGLIQFMPDTARALGTSTDALARMSAADQQVYVERYFRPYVGHLGTLESAYLAVLWPAAVGRDPATVIFRDGDGTKRYLQNRGLDLDRDGDVTAAEATTPVRRILENAHGWIDVPDVDDVGSPPPLVPFEPAREHGAESEIGPERVVLWGAGCWGLWHLIQWALGFRKASADASKYSADDQEPKP